MRKLINYSLLLFCAATLYSCSEETITDETVEELLTSPGAATKNLQLNVQNCNYQLTDLKAGTQKNISCIVDLKGQTVRLENNISLVYDGGDIINGTVIFKNGKIDGRLLNKDLQLKGNVSLIDPIFNFQPSRWDLVQGRTSFRNALKNRLNIEEIIGMVKNLGGTTFRIDDFDAYFEVSEVTSETNPNFYPWEEGINVPSDFNLVMTDNTHLRVFPNNSKKYALLSVYKASNVRISGGVLHGDRDEHDYSGGTTHEWGHVILLKSAVNTVVSNTLIKDGTGDGIKIESTGFSFQSDYDMSYDINLNGCIFDSNRRNNLAITDGKDIIVENCEFYRAGVDTQYSKGTNPKASIDVEAYRNRVNGEIVYYEKVDGVLIKNNYQRGSAHTGFLVAIGDNVTIEDNDVENGISYRYANGTTIRNNTLTAENLHSGLAIGGGDMDSDLISNNRIYGNLIQNYDIGIRIEGKDHLVQNNIIINCKTGITGLKFSETKVIGNKITADDPSSRGIFVHYTSMNRVLFKENVVNTPNNAFKFDLINLGRDEKEYCAHLVNNTFKSNYVGILRNSNGVSLMKNKIDMGLEIYDSKNFVLEDNTITSANSDGIYFRDENEAVALTNNAINVPQNKQCIRIQSTTNGAEVQRINNRCLN